MYDVTLELEGAEPEAMSDDAILLTIAEVELAQYRLSEMQTLLVQHLNSRR